MCFASNLAKEEIIEAVFAFPVTRESANLYIQFCFTFLDYANVNVFHQLLKVNHREIEQSIFDKLLPITRLKSRLFESLMRVDNEGFEYDLPFFLHEFLILLRSDTLDRKTPLTDFYLD
jgi:hypothetical protein